MYIKFVNKLGNRRHQTPPPLLVRCSRAPLISQCETRLRDVTVSMTISHDVKFVLLLVQRWRHPQNRKYITYGGNACSGEPSHSHITFYDIWPYHALMKFGKFKRMPFIIQCTSEVQRLQSSHQWLAECDIKPGAKSAIAELPCFADFLPQFDLL